MKKLTRREFLKLAALGTGGLLLEQVLAACGIKATPATTTTPEPVNTSSPSPETVTTLSPTNITSTGAAPTAATSAVPDLVVVRGGEPEPMVRQALAALGGIQAFVPSGAKVILKPNICVSYRTYEFAATTNPWVVGALVKLCLEAGAASVKVMDYPFSGSARDAYNTCGIQEQVEAAGGQMEIMSNLKYVSTPIPRGVSLKSASAYKDALDADVLINVPIAKQHSNTGLSLGLKNLMGLVPDHDRDTMHSTSIHQGIADLASLFQPVVKLTLMDAVRILTDGGPQGGDLAAVKKLDTIIAGVDMVAVDSYATGLFGKTPEGVPYFTVPYITKAAALGLGRSDLTNLNIQELAANG